MPSTLIFNIGDPILFASALLLNREKCFCTTNTVMSEKALNYRKESLKSSPHLTDKD